MIDYQEFCQIKDLHGNQGLNAAQIAVVLDLDPRTVSYWLSQERFRGRKATPRASKLDPFKPHIIQMLDKYPYSAAQVLQRLRQQGFDGGYSIVKDYVRTVRPRRQPAFLKLAFAPGECAQVDWGSFGSVPVGQTTRRLSFFVMVMCYSRMMYVEFTVSQTMEHVLACHQHAFEFFGATPETVMVDNLKSAVLRRALGEAPVFNPKYAAFAEHYDFRMVPCNVGKGNEKGRVENGVGSVKKNFLAGLEIADFRQLNPAARHWLDTIANVRHHGETRDLKLTFIAEHYADLAKQAATQQSAHIEYLGQLVEGEARRRRDRATQNRIRQARFPVIKTLDQFRWDWPAQINRAQVQHHFTLSFLSDHSHLIYLGRVGLGKTHLAIALA